VARRQGEPLAAAPATAAAAPATAAVTGSLPHPLAEPQLLDYATHQAKLMPLLATAYAFAFTAHRMKVRGSHADVAAVIMRVFLRSTPIALFLRLLLHATDYSCPLCSPICCHRSSTTTS
jgi:hypothetical protein